MIMGFQAISTEDFLATYHKNNPKEELKKVRQELERALADYKDGITCKCGNDIWVIGSAIVGNMCYTCITGEVFPDEDYELKDALKKRKNVRKGRNISDMDPEMIGGFFDDEGKEINMDLIEKPGLCLICKKENDPAEEILCNLNRIDQREEEEFFCYAFVQK